jgi:beta-mannosidase
MEKCSLNGEWYFCDEKKEILKDPIPGEVPGTVYTDLMKNGIIPDVFYGTNEEIVRWVEEKNWLYRKEFSLSDAFLKCKKVFLIFEGVDTYAEIYLNGKLLCKTDNMFHPYVLEVEKYIMKDNVVEVKFLSPVKVLQKLEGEYGPVMETPFVSFRAYGRKAQYSFGWDWGPRFPTCGLWKDVYLLGLNYGKIENVLVKQQITSKNKAIIEVEVEANCYFKGDAIFEFTLQNSKNKKTVRHHIIEGYNVIKTKHEINNPKLWFPNGYGKANLYTLIVRFKYNDLLLDEKIVKFGLRTVELLQEKDKEGRNFIFKINGIKIFCKGFNWIPSDSFLPRLTEEKYRKLLLLAKEANTNMIRVWGGGIYENDIFYDICDELGIMIWQDFMSACQEVPGNQDWFCEAFRKEAIYQVKRLRNHPSIVLWCGNNENEFAKYRVWGGKDKKEYLGEKIFYNILPEICNIYDSTRPYLPSSPYSADEFSPQSQTNGDYHSYEGWCGGNWEKFSEIRGRFLSEIGYQSFPDIETVEQFTPPEERCIKSKTILSHEKASPEAIDWIENGIRDRLGFKTENLEEFVYLSQVNWAEGVRYVIEHWRKRKFNTAGILFWQLNDCWPVISWSFVDYYLRPKLCYYSAKRFFAPVILSIERKNELVKIHIINDKLTPYRGKLSIAVIDFYGKTYFKKIIPVAVEENSNKTVSVGEIPFTNVTGQLLIAELFEKGKIIFKNFLFCKNYKELDLPQPEIEIKTKKINPNTINLTLKTPVVVPAVKISTDVVSNYSDNFLFLMPNEEKTVTITSNEKIKKITVRGVNFVKYLNLI